MIVEIEHRLLLKHDGWRNQASAPQTLHQGYISVEKERTIRVRITGNRTWLVLKGYISGFSRNEFEYEIPPEHARQMMDGMYPLKMEERRHHAPHGGLVSEINEYGGDNTLLIAAEIELPSEDARFGKPNWLGEEITFDGRFTNAYLSRHPYSAWEK